MVGEFAGKVALVVGGSRGVGRAYTLGLARAGAQVAAISRNLELEELHASQKEAKNLGIEPGPPIFGFGVNITKADQIEHAVERVLSEFGRIDILVYNAAGYRLVKPFEASEKDWDLSFNLNVRAPYKFIQMIAPQMMQRKSGNIILLSTRASLAVPFEDASHDLNLAYGVSKAALNRLGTYFSEELKSHGVAVNILSPGKVDELAEGREPTVEQFAPPLLHLAKQTPDTLTGQWRNTTDFGVAWP